MLAKRPWQDVRVSGNPEKFFRFSLGNSVVIWREMMVTVKDVAREAGVSYSTVSVAIGNRRTRIPIAPATREKVLAAAKRLG